MLLSELPCKKDDEEFSLDITLLINRLDKMFIPTCRNTNSN